MTVGYGNHEAPRTETPPTSPNGAKPAPTEPAATADQDGKAGEDNTATPGTGALPADNHGDEVDPGDG
jgi:hypothetical protein